MNPPHSQVDSSDQLTPRQKAELERMLENFMNKRGVSSSIPPLTQVHTSVPPQSQGQTSTEFKKVLHEYLNTTGGPLNPPQYSSLKALLKQAQNSNSVEHLEKPPIFTTTPNLISTEFQKAKEQQRVEKAKEVLISSHSD